MQPCIPDKLNETNGINNFRTLNKVNFNISFCVSLLFADKINATDKLNKTNYRNYFRTLVNFNGVTTKYGKLIISPVVD